MKTVKAMLLSLLLLSAGVAASGQQFDIKTDYSLVKAAMIVTPATITVQYATPVMAQQWTISRYVPADLNLVNGDILRVKDEGDQIKVVQMDPGWQTPMDVTTKPTNENLSDISLLDLSGEGSMGDH